MPHAPGAAPLFQTANFAARELGAAELPLLQTLFEANPEYFLGVTGKSPGPEAAVEEFNDLPPASMNWTRRRVLGFFDASHHLEGMAVIVSDLCAPGVWHVALFLMATARHGTGAAQEIYGAIESWMKQGGALWLRLGVVRGQSRAERFWERLGFREVRLREGIDTGGKINAVRVLVKPLTGAGIDAYLEAVPRDHPESVLP